MSNVIEKEAFNAKLVEIANMGKQASNEMAPYIDHTANGVFHVTRQQDKDTGEVVEKRILLSSAFNHLGGGVDDMGNHYAIIEKPKRHNNPCKTIILPMGDIGTGQGWKTLQNAGLMIKAARRGRDTLADHLQEHGQGIAYSITERGGWCHDGKAYILPNGEVITDTDNLNVLYNGDKSQAAAFQSKGDTKTWNDAIGCYLAGNSRLCLAVGTALAAPLLKLLNMESGGFHIHGDSSDGKTTAAKVALSVWANPNDAKTSWNGTGYAFANIANSRNDNFMMLDEIGEAPQKAVNDVAYSVLNGTGKAQGHKDGGNREVKKWRVLVFSTGEKTINGYIERGGKFQWQAGQETRLPSIPANAGKGLGVFDVLHSFDSGKAFSEYLNDATAEHYGALGTAFVHRIIGNQEAVINATKTHINAFKSTLPKMGSQAGRIANRFALVAAALQVACDIGLLAINGNEAANSIKQCLNDWIARSGTGNYEEKRIIEQAAVFFEQAAYSRFVSTNKANNHEHTPPNFAGLREERGEQLPMYYVLTGVFDAEICQDFDRHKVIAVLGGIDWLTLPKGAHKTIKKRFNGEMKRYFVFEGSAPPDHQEA